MSRRPNSRKQPPRVPPRHNGPSPRLFAAEGPWQEAREGEFEMMDISLTVLGLTGIMNEAVKTKKSRKSATTGGGNSGQSRSASRTMIGASSSSGESSDMDQIPVTAVASFFKNVTSNKTSIGTHLPSLPLATPTASFGNTSRYMASWPSPFDAASRGGHTRGMANGNASFKFSRVMKRHVVDGSWDGEDPSVIDGGGNLVFTPETMDILVGLARGSDMIPLGVATLVVTGEEVGEVQVNLPVKTGSDALASMNAVNVKKAKGKSQKMFKALAKGAKNSKKGAFFKVAPGSLYRLDETAALRLLVKAVPRNGGYDHDGSIVSALSCPTGSSEGSSSETSSSESEDDDYDDYDDEYDEPSAVKSRPSQQSQQQSTPSHPSRDSRDSRVPIPPRGPQSQMSMGHPPPSMHNMHPNAIPKPPHHQRLPSPHMLQQRSLHGAPTSGGRVSHPHPHFAVQPVTSEASTEPGYGDEFEGAPSNQDNTMDGGPSSRPPMSPIEMNARTHSKKSRETAMTTPATSEDSSIGFMVHPKAPSCEPCTNVFSCSAMSSLCLIDNDEEPLRPSRRKPKPPMKNIFTDAEKKGRGESRRNGGHRRRDEYTRVEPTIASSASESSQSMGSETYQDVQKTRDKLRQYAHRMGIDPEQLL